MRALALSLLAAACATVTPAAPPDRVAGCWINRDGAAAMTMRWTPNNERMPALDGTRLSFGQAGVTSSTHYALEPSEAGWSLCEIGADSAAVRCWRVAEGEGGSLDGGRAFIDRHGDRLRITIVGDGPEQLVFQGRRDGCD